jgi:hypothetical protein
MAPELRHLGHFLADHARAAGLPAVLNGRPLLGLATLEALRLRRENAEPAMVALPVARANLLLLVLPHLKG